MESEEKMYTLSHRCDLCSLDKTHINAMQDRPLPICLSVAVCRSAALYKEIFES